jgi:hypothetical protein
MLRDEYEKRIETLKSQHELSVKRLNDEIEKLYGEKQDLQKELENKISDAASVKMSTNVQTYHHQQQYRNHVQKNPDQHLEMMTGNSHRTNVNQLSSNSSSASNASGGVRIGKRISLRNQVRKVRNI